jgi:hypothetical protein
MTCKQSPTRRPSRTHYAIKIPPKPRPKPVSPAVPTTGHRPAGPSTRPPPLDQTKYKYSHRIKMRGIDTAKQAYCNAQIYFRTGHRVRPSATRPRLTMLVFALQHTNSPAGRSCIRCGTSLCARAPPDENGKGTTVARFAWKQIQNISFQVKMPG